MDRPGGTGGDAVARRLAALRASGLLDAPLEAAFDRLTRIACRLFGTPTAFVALADDTNLLFVSARGLPAAWGGRREVPLARTFSGRVIESDSPLAVPDARAHPLSHGNATARQLGTAAFLGVPLRAAGSVPVGALCTVDAVPRTWAEEDVGLLVDVAAGVEAELALRERAREIEAAHRLLHDAVESLPDAFALYDADDRLVLWNRRYPEHFPRSAELLAPGVPFARILREGALRGEYRGVDESNLEAWLAEQLEIHRSGASHELEFADGRWLCGRTRRTSDGGIVGIRSDITERKRLEQQVEHLAMHDPLTGLPNRRLFLRELDRAHARAARDGGRRLVVMLLDLDGFKRVNDTLGHGVGDALLAEVACRLAGCVRRGDLAARLAGDEFALISEGGADEPGHARDAGHLAERVVAALSEPVEIPGTSVPLRPGVSLGLTVFPDDQGDPRELLRHADEALYRAKAAGRGTWRAYAAGGIGEEGNGCGSGTRRAALSPAVLGPC